MIGSGERGPTSVLEDEELVEDLHFHAVLDRNPFVDALAVPSADLAAEVFREVGAVPARDVGVLRVELIALDVQRRFLGVATYDLTFSRQVDEDELVLVRSGQTLQAVIDDTVGQRFWSLYLTAADVLLGPDEFSKLVRDGIAVVGHHKVLAAV